MNPATHFLAGWAVANAGSLGRRDRALVTLAGVVPDVDGFGILPELLTLGSERPIRWWSDYHHVLGHNLLLGVLVTAGVFAVARRRARAAALAFAGFHLHLVCDLAGARGPDGSQWEIPYLWPFWKSWLLAWSGQWELNAWPNILMTVALLAAMFYLAWRRGYSPVGIVSERADAAFVATLRRRVPLSGGPSAAEETEGAENEK